MITLDNIYRASFALKSIIRRTDLIFAPQINPESQIYLKPENLQYTGSFKLRGACYKIACLTEEEKKKGVIACSAGNHAQGVALGATKNGIDSLICLPEGAPISKVEATKRYGAKVCLVPGVYDDAYQKALQLKEEKGYTFIHPFDDEYVIAGQGTIGLELLNQLPDVEAVIVPVGGGGLISGVAFALKSLKPDVKVYGVQAQGAASMLRSIEDAHRECLPSVSTVADGIAVKEPGEITFDICRKYVDGIVTVTEDEICAAILALMEQQKLMPPPEETPAMAAAQETQAPSEADYFKDINNVYSLLSVEPIEMEFGYSLIPLVDESSGGKLISRIVIFRRQFAQDMGFVIPSIRLHDGAALGTNQYVIKIRGE